MTTRAIHLAHLVRMALNPGFAAHAAQRAQELDNTLFPGIRAEARAEMVRLKLEREAQKLSGAVPASGE